MPIPGSVRDRVVVVSLVLVLLGGLIVAAVIDRLPNSKVGAAQSQPPSSSAAGSSEPGTSSSSSSASDGVVPGSSTAPASTSAPAVTASPSSASPSLAKQTTKPKPKPKPTPKPTVKPTVTAKPTPTASPTAPEPPGKPGPTNTGVPPGTKLTVVHGSVTVTTPGTVIDSQDIKGQLIILASNVTVKRSLIEGVKGQDASVDIQCTTCSGILLEDDEVTDTYPAVGNDDMRVRNATLLRLNIHGGVDGMKLFSNSTVSASWIHGLTYFAHDPGQANGHTHNDTIQIVGGSNFHIIGNWLQSGTMDNSAIQVTQSIGKISSLFISGNWADGGGCSFNFSGHNGAGKELPLNGITVVANRFGHTSSVYDGNCAIVDTPATHLVSSIGNVWDVSGTPVKIYD
jgi:hypothetical protein